jgi:hypothetical protein
MPEDSRPQKLTVDDPVSKEIISELKDLSTARANIAMSLLDLEQERVRLLGAAHQVDTQNSRIFERINMERGLAPDTSIEIDPESGKIMLKREQ